MRVPKTLSQTITDYSHPSAKNNKIFFLSTIFNEVSIKILPFKNGLDKKETWIFSIQFLPQCRVPLWSMNNWISIFKFLSLTPIVLTSCWNSAQHQNFQTIKQELMVVWQKCESFHSHSNRLEWPWYYLKSSNFLHTCIVQSTWY